MEAVITTFSNFPVTELIPTGERFLQRRKEEEQKEWQVTEKNIEARDNNGKTALDIARLRKRHGVVEVLEAAHNS